MYIAGTEGEQEQNQLTATNPPTHNRHAHSHLTAHTDRLTHAHVKYLSLAVKVTISFNTYAASLVSSFHKWKLNTILRHTNRERRMGRRLRPGYLSADLVDHWNTQGQAGRCGEGVVSIPQLVVSIYMSGSLRICFSLYICFVTFI